MYGFVLINQKYGNLPMTYSDLMSDNAASCYQLTAAVLINFVIHCYPDPWREQVWYLNHMEP